MNFNLTAELQPRTIPHELSQDSGSRCLNHSKPKLARSHDTHDPHVHYISRTRQRLRSDGGGGAGGSSGKGRRVLATPWYWRQEVVVVGWWSELEVAAG